MPSFLYADSLRGLGWCLLNSLWQMGIFWLGYLLLTGTNKRFSAAGKHNLALVFSGAGLIWFLAGLAGSGREQPSPWLFNLTWDRFSAATGSAMPMLACLYLVTLAWLACRYLLGFFQLNQNRKRDAFSCSETLQGFADRFSAAAGIRKPVKVLLVDWTDTAHTIGYFKPLVLLPVALVNGLSQEQTEAILVHELYHIRRNDYLINIGMTIFRALFFFNPFALFFFKTIARERELACDDGVLQWNYPALVYAEALLILEKFRQVPPALSLAANGNNPRLLMERIRRVIGQPTTSKNPFSPVLSSFLMTAFFLFAFHSFSPLREAAPAHKTQDRFTASARMTSVRVVSENASGKTHRPTHKKPAMAMASQTKKFVKHEIMSAVTTASEETEAAELAQYTRRNELRNYSNEKDPQPELPLHAAMTGIPYTPSASFTYVPLVDTLGPEVLQENKLKALLAVGKIKTAEIQITLHDQISRSVKELRILKTQSVKLLKGNQKKLQPEQQKIHRTIELKKEEIRQYQLEMQVLRGEVITI